MVERLSSSVTLRDTLTSVCVSSILTVNKWKSQIWFSVIHIGSNSFISSRVYHEPIKWPAPSWLVSSEEHCIGIAEVMGSTPRYRPEFFQYLLSLLLIISSVHYFEVHSRIHFPHCFLNIPKGADKDNLLNNQDVL